MTRVVIFDYGHTLLDNENSKLYPGAVELLNFLDEKGIKICLISGTSKEEFRLQQLNEFGILPYFQYINFIPHQETKNFQPVLAKFKVKPEEVLVVGDRITSEISEGIKLGMKTCRILRGPEKDLIAQNSLETPSYEVEDLREVIYLI